MPRSLEDSEIEREPGFEAIHTAHHDQIVRLAHLMVRSEAVAEELGQEAFLRLYSGFDDIKSPSGFLRAVVVRLAITWRSRRDMEHERLRLVATSGQTEVSEPDEMWDAIGRLRPERGAVLVLRYYADLSHRDIGRTLGCPTATARSRLRRALADLREELER